MINKYYSSILLSILIIVLTTVMPFFLMKVSFSYLLVAFFLLFFYIPYLEIKKKQESRLIKIKYLIIVLPFFLIYSITLIFAKNLFALPLSFSIILGGFLSYKLLYKDLLLKILISIATVVLLFVTYPKYTAELYYQQALVNEQLSEKIILKSVESPDLKYVTTNNKLTILEFWNSACAQCIKEFPKFQNFYDQNKKEYNVYSVNIPWKRDIKNNFNPSKLTDSMGYNFPVLIGNEEIMKKLNIYAFPMVLVINKDNQIKYRGRMNYGANGRYNFENILKKIDNE